MGHFLRDDEINSLISGIYDCAIDPTGWVEFLGRLCQAASVKMATISLLTPPAPGSGDRPGLKLLNSPNDMMLGQVLTEVPMSPVCGRWQTNEIDIPESEIQLMTEEGFRQSDFYREWAEPIGHYDTCCSVLVRRPNILATLAVTTSPEHGAVDDQQRSLLRILSPHFRRALLIGDLLDEAMEERRVYRATLDSLAAGVVLVDEDARILHANRAAEANLRGDGPLQDLSGRLWTHSAPHRAAFLAAIRRACTLPEVALGTWGSGIALTGPGNSQIAAYVLPLGQSSHRRSLGPGKAAVFVTDRQGSRPPPVEILSALSGLTTAESRAALGIADGTPLEHLAENLGISLLTLRKHLANAYEKTGHNSQAALGAFVNRLRVPLA